VALGDYRAINMHLINSIGLFAISTTIRVFFGTSRAPLAQQFYDSRILLRVIVPIRHNFPIQGKCYSVCRIGHFLVGHFLA
jgi:hypothetical protein